MPLVRPGETATAYFGMQPDAQSQANILPQRSGLVKILSSGEAKRRRRTVCTPSRFNEAWRKEIYQDAFLTPGIWPL